MTHRREEGRLRLVGRFRLGPRRLGDVALTLSGLARRLQLFEQAHVLDGDNGLIGEGRDQFDLALGERLRVGAPEPHHADRHAFPQQWYAEHAADSADPRILFGSVFGVAPRV